MIYKFKFEVYDDDNELMQSSRSEESGNFWWALTKFMQFLMGYAEVVIKVNEAEAEADRLDRIATAEKRDYFRSERSEP